MEKIFHKHIFSGNGIQKRSQMFSASEDNWKFRASGEEVIICPHRHAISMIPMLVWESYLEVKENIAQIDLQAQSLNYTHWPVS